VTVRHPSPPTLVRYLRHMADVIDDQGQKAIDQAHLLSARGWPSSTSGAAVISSGNGSSSTERAALNPNPFDGLGDQLARELRAAWKALLDVEGTMARVMSHASDDDPIPVGTGHCLRCETFCRPDDQRPHNRIRSGFCPACDTAWRRAGKPDRGEFIRSYEPPRQATG
jgi:hypothetical protein